MKILVKSDVYNICNRIKKFDCSYKVVFNTFNNQYEIYSTKLGQSIEVISGVVLSYVCTLPYKQLDYRTIKYLHDTSVENIQNLIDKIDKSNHQLERENQTKIINQSVEFVENRLRQLT